MRKKLILCIITIALLVAIPVTAITISTTDICIEGTDPLSGLFTQVIEKLTAIEEKLPKQTSDSASLCEPVLYDKIRLGQAFSASHRFDAVAAGANVSMYFSVPSDGTTVTIVAIEVVTTGQGAIDIYRYPSMITAGTQITPTNLNMSSSNTSEVVVGYEYTVDLSSATKAHETVAPGGTKVRAIGSLSEVGERIIIPPGNSLIVIFTNRGSTSEDVSIRFIWFEEYAS